MSVRVRCAMCMKEIEYDVESHEGSGMSCQEVTVRCHGKTAVYDLWWNRLERATTHKYTKMDTVYFFLGDDNGCSFWPPIIKGKLRTISDV
jgi:hypothetical protein